MTGSSMRDADISVLTLPREPPPASPPRGNRRWPAWIGACAAVGIGIALLYGLLPLGSAALEVDAVPVRLIGHHVSTAALSASGYVVAQRQASVASKGTGRLEHLAVTVGSQVKAGDLVARVQQDDVQAVQHQARARLEVAKSFGFTDANNNGRIDRTPSELAPANVQVDMRLSKTLKNGIDIYVGADNITESRVPVSTTFPLEGQHLYYVGMRMTL